jgi:hypothetical protein
MTQIATKFCMIARPRACGSRHGRMPSARIHPSQRAGASTGHEDLASGRSTLWLPRSEGESARGIKVGKNSRHQGTAWRPHRKESSRDLLLPLWSCSPPSSPWRRGGFLLSSHWLRRSASRASPGLAPVPALLAGLSNGGIITVAAMLVIAKGIVHTGAVTRVTWALLSTVTSAQHALRRLALPIGVGIRPDEHHPDRCHARPGSQGTGAEPRHQRPRVAAAHRAHHDSGRLGNP